MPFALAVGLSSHVLSLDLFEKFAIGPDRLTKVHSDLLGRGAISEAVVLSTCERLEIFVVVDRYHTGLSEIRTFLSEYSGLEPHEFADSEEVFFEEGAVRHLFATASGLNSSVLGEAEILGQVRIAWETSRAEGATGLTLDALFAEAIAVGRKARTETAIMRGTTSLSQAAVQLSAAKFANGLKQRQVLLIGAGEMGEGVARAASSVDGIGAVLVANRTGEKAVNLVSKLPSHTESLEFQDVGRCLVNDVDVMISTVSQRMDFASPASFEALIKSRNGRPLLVVDLAMPRSIDPAVGQVGGIQLLDLEEITNYAEKSHRERAAEIPAVEDLIDERVESFLHGVQEREVEPLVASLYDRAESVRVGELDRFSKRLQALDPETRNTVEALTKGIVAKLLHEPATQLKDRSGTAHGRRMASEIRKAFDL